MPRKQTRTTTDREIKAFWAKIKKILNKRDAEIKRINAKYDKLLKKEKDAFWKNR